MPMDRSRYPKDWEAIALKVKSDADWTCQQCNRPCRRPGESDDDLMERIEVYHPSWAYDLAEWDMDDEHGAVEVRKLTRFTLTTAHPNHDPENPDAELRAWCSVCHCRYDLKEIQRKKRLRKEHLGQMNLFEGTK